MCMMLILAVQDTGVSEGIVPHEQELPATDVPGQSEPATTVPAPGSGLSTPPPHRFTPPSRVSDPHHRDTLLRGGAGQCSRVSVLGRLDYLRLFSPRRALSVRLT
jgi:hypothetical protein